MNLFIILIFFLNLLVRIKKKKRKKEGFYSSLNMYKKRKAKNRYALTYCPFGYRFSFSLGQRDTEALAGKPVLRWNPI